MTSLRTQRSGVKQSHYSTMSEIASYRTCGTRKDVLFLLCGQTLFNFSFLIYCDLMICIKKWYIYRKNNINKRRISLPKNNE